MDTLVRLRTLMIMQITENANLVRQLRGLPPSNVEYESWFENIMLNASSEELLDLIIHSTKDVIKHQKVTGA